jgi:hypothetical protein
VCAGEEESATRCRPLLSIHLRDKADLFRHKPLYHGKRLPQDTRVYAHLNLKLPKTKIYISRLPAIIANDNAADVTHESPDPII